VILNSHIATLNELPDPPEGIVGWPWTIEIKQLKSSFSNVRQWPKISIVTPSFNQAQFLEETIRSVILQNYPNFEYIIIDGGSTDRSIEIIKKYSRWLKYWISEPDNGQSHAINKGFARADGKIFGYINSDDFYEPGTFQTIAEVFIKNPNCNLVAGECIILNGDITSRFIKPWWPQNLSHFVKKTYSSTFAQPASFWTKTIFNQLGGFDESLNYCFDREFFLRMGLKGISPFLIPQKIARFRKHPDSKTMKQGIEFHRESVKILFKHANPCGIDRIERKKIKKNIKNEIKYIEIFSLWNKKGRKYAILHYIKMIMCSPTLLFQRKILGQGRRLFLFKAKNVAELKMV